MSSGRYGGVAERTCMKPFDWPLADQRLWSAATAPADPFAEHGGTRAAHRAISNHGIAQGYGRWLTFLSRRGALGGTDDPAARITSEAVRGYILELDTLGNKKGTILVRLEALTEMAKVLDPRRDWQFIRRMVAKVRARQELASTTQSHLVLSDQLLNLGIDLIERAARQPTPLEAAVFFRDGLIIALLALRPLRRRNLADLTIGGDLVKENEKWTIVLLPSAMKTKVTLEYEWPEPLNAFLETYLAQHRPILLARNGRWKAPVQNRLWVSSDGSPLTQMAIYDRIIIRTRAAFGQSVNPHFFRNAAATTIAIHDPNHVRLGAPLLGHRTFGTTEGSYIKAETLKAHREFASKIASLRLQPVPDKESNP